MMDFLSFHSLISLDILIFCYYIGALVVPILIWYGRRYMMDRFKLLAKIEEFFLSMHYKSSKKSKIITNSFAILSIVCMEICWRMMFEMMIAYFQMREYLYHLNTLVLGVNR